MSEFTNHQKERIEQLELLFQGILKGENLRELVDANKILIENCIPSDVIYLVDKLVLSETPINELKKGINKLLNLLYKTITEYNYFPPKSESYLGCLIENNKVLDEKLKLLKPEIRELNSNPDDIEKKQNLHQQFSELDKFESFYAIKENVLFPVIEKHIPEFRCLKVMWSFHDDIRRNLKLALKELQNENIDLKVFNRAAGDLFFNMYAIKFREERILYPLVEAKIPEKELNALFEESFEIGFPFYTPKIKPLEVLNKTKKDDLMDLETGFLSLEQIKLLFNHLPVDITFVDENNKVRYFSTPEKRIFRRTKSIIGRDVHNCHPPESVHVVEQIVDAFKAGKKSKASFWINMKGEMYLIQYFAIRNEKGEYKGVVEVSQEITEIQNLEGEKRLLDWEE